MKIAGIAICTIFLLGCGSEPAKKADNNIEIQPVDTICYAFTNTRDTVLLNILAVGTSINGTLTYNYYEKDKNTGILSGKIIGDTMLADYTYNSEGTTSIRELVLVKRNDGTLMQGYGEMEEKGNIQSFKNRRYLVFDTVNLLKPVDCW